MRCATAPTWPESGSATLGVGAVRVRQRPPAEREDRVGPASRRALTLTSRSGGSGCAPRRSTSTLQRPRCWTSASTTVPIWVRLRAAGRPALGGADGPGCRPARPRAGGSPGTGSGRLGGGRAGVWGHRADPPPRAGSPRRSSCAGGRRPGWSGAGLHRLRSDAHPGRHREVGARGRIRRSPSSATRSGRAEHGTRTGRCSSRSVPPSAETP
jgi:hypothetical protein